MMHKPRRTSPSRTSLCVACPSSLPNTNALRSHHIFLLTLNDKLFVAPLKNPKRALDIGAGSTGIWAL